MHQKPDRIVVREYLPTDWPQMWPFLQSTFAGGDTFAFAPAITESDTKTAWIDWPLKTYVAVRLWQKLGFSIVSTVPEAFKHSRFGLVAAHVMYKRL